MDDVEVLASGGQLTVEGPSTPAASAPARSDQESEILHGESRWDTPCCARWRGLMSAARERRLLRRAARGDRRALQCLYDEHSEQLFAVAYRLTESSADARDVLHDVLGDLPDIFRRFDGRRPLGPWLRSVTARFALRHVRSERRRQEAATAWATDEEVVASPESSVLDSIVLERALSSLREKLRTVVVLKDLEGYSHREIAELLEIERVTSEARLYRARQQLRAMLVER
ncbi:MAG: sigma-70 family RNA polymerase sigma factor [Gemmatimonadales bacterium]|nr:sigma-70 family RNA polymerase sigma factor [Gemmatimonadales bacterium]MYC87209.1 sigma-70 family RNA polymerase sigma factor [Candidatus Palauibacter denitrificans]